MIATEDFDNVLKQYRIASVELIKGNPEPYKMLFSHREDVTLANPYYPPVRGWEHVSATLDRTASRLRDGEVVDVEIISKYVTPELAYVVQVVHERAKVGGRQDTTPITLRNTLIFRPEDGTWKVVHLHGDPITSPQSAESVIQK